MHEVEITVLVEGSPIGVIEKEIKGSLEEVQKEIDATLERNRASNPDLKLDFEISIDGVPQK